MKPVAYLYVASVLTSAFLGLTACDSSSGGGSAAGAGGTGNFLGGGAGTTGGTTVIDEPGGAAGKGTGGKAGSTSTQGGGTDDTFGGGGDDQGTQGGGTNTTQGGGGTGSGQTCSECAQDACADEYDACGSSDDCKAVSTCLQACKDQPCQQACLDENPTGGEIFLALNDCLGDKCSDPCSGSADPCETCIQASCADELNACTDDAECSALIDCLGDCPSGDSACQQACGSSHQAGVSLYQAAGTCVNTKCKTDCG